MAGVAGGVISRWVKRLRRGHHLVQQRESQPRYQYSLTEAEGALAWDAYNLLHRDDENPGGICIRNIEFVVQNDPDLTRRVIAECTDEEKKDFWSRRFSNQYVAPQAGEYEPSLVWLIEKKLNRVRQSLVTVSAASSLFTSEDRNHMFFESSAFYYVDGLAVRLASEGASEERLRACTAMAYIHGVHRRDIFPDAVNLPASEIDFFVANYSRIKPFIPHLFARRSTDSGFIRTMIGGDTPVLAEGAL